MDERIDFTKPWRMSDVVIHTMNSNDVGLHASKSLLSMYSPYFQAMFFGGFKEKDAEQVELQEDFTVVQNALRILHQQDRLEPGGLSMDYSLSELSELYVFADKCDVALIRELCKAQLAKKKVKTALEVAIQLGLDDVKSKLVESLEPSVLRDFLKAHGKDRTFTNDEVNVLVKKLTEAPLPTPHTETMVRHRNRLVLK